MSTPSRLVRTVALIAAAGMALVACTTAAPSEPGAESTPSSAPEAQGPRALEPIEQTKTEDVPSALDNPDDPAFPKPLIDTNLIRSGGPPPDGIPPIDEPLFESAEDVDWLVDQEPVLSLEIDGETRAYPIQIMIWHEIVNDTVAGVPISVTYCPLCNSALAFDRRVGERVVTFGTSGSVYNSDLVMYDRQTESLWPQIEGRAAVGVLAGTELERIPVATVPWQQWREANPDGWVLSQQTGFDRSYGSNPYELYDQEDSEPFLFDGEIDTRLAPKERVVAIDGPDPVAIPLERVAQDRVVPLQVDGEPVVVWAISGLNSALDSGQISKGREIAASGVFDSVVEGDRLTFTSAGPDEFRDRQTGSRWNVLGRSVAGPLEGTQLRAIPHVDTFWFAWAAFEPDTRLEG